VHLRGDVGHPDRRLEAAARCFEMDRRPNKKTMDSWSTTSCGGTSSVTRVIAALRPLAWTASVNEAEGTEKWEVFIWPEERWINKLSSLRGTGKSYSDMILRTASCGPVA
jgi:hypothetical protein